MKEKIKKIWHQFAGKRNSDDILIEKARAVAPLIFRFATKDTKDLLEELKKDEEMRVDDKSGKVFSEIILLYLHFVDRIAFQYLEAEQRNIFVDTLFKEVTTLFAEYLSYTNKNKIDVAHFKSLFTNTHNERQKEYGKYKMFTGKDEGMKGTLSWEFGKKVAALFGSEMDIFIIMQAQIVFVSLNFLFLPELLKEDDQ